MLWSRRSVFLALLVGGPVVLAAISRLVWMMAPAESLTINGASVSGAGIFGLMIWLLYVRFIVPILGVFYGTALVADAKKIDHRIGDLIARRRDKAMAGPIKGRVGTPWVWVKRITRLDEAALYPKRLGIAKHHAYQVQGVRVMLDQVCVEVHRGIAWLTNRATENCIAQPFVPIMVPP